MLNSPNIILISTDQQRGDCLGVERRGVSTPHLDALCTRGTRFANCITPNPMCQPARASILTGKLPYSHGVRDNGRDLDPAFAADGLAGVFTGAGYATHFLGKAHFSTHETFAPTGRAECYHSTADFPATWDGPYFGFERAALTLRPHHHCAWTDAPYTLHYENFLDADGQGGARWQRAKDHTGTPTRHMQAWRSALSEEWHSTAWIGDLAVDVIEAAGDQPFFVWVSFPDPHPPFLAPDPWAGMYDPEGVDLPPHRALNFDGRPWWHQAFVDSPARKAVKRTHAQDGKDWGATGELSDGVLRDITALYYGMISAVDHQVGRIVAALEAAELADNTVIAFISDHGEWLGDHGHLLKGPMLYDGLLRVPCILVGPGIPANHVVSDPVSILDLRQTLAELAGLAVAPDDGASLVPVMNGQETRDFALNEWEVDADRSGIALDLRTVRSARHRLSVDLRSGAGELYDLNDDPFETTNLFGDPTARTAQDALMGAIAARPDTMIPAAPRVGWH